MKRIAFVVCLIGSVMVAFAQGETTGDKMYWFRGGNIKFGKPVAESKKDAPWLNETRFGIEAGSGISNIFSSNLSQKSQPNASAGVFVNGYYGGFLFETGLRWHRRSYELTGFLPQYAPSTTKLELNPQYLELPVMAGTMFRLSDLSKHADVRLGVKLGMYVAVGIAGDGKYYGSGGNTSATDIDNLFKRQSINPGTLEFEPMKRFDVGGKFGVDIYINRWKLGFEYTRGWKDFSSGYDRHLKTKSFDFKIGFVLGYRKSTK